MGMGWQHFVITHVEASADGSYWNLIYNEALAIGDQAEEINAVGWGIGVPVASYPARPCVGDAISVDAVRGGSLVDRLAIGETLCWDKRPNTRRIP